MANKLGIQSLVFSGHARLPQSVFMCLHVRDAELARERLGELVRCHVSFDIPDPTRTHAVQLLVSGAGIRALTGQENSDNGLSREFRQGIAAPHRQLILGDHGSNAPECWMWSDSECHVAVLIYALSCSQIDRLQQELSGLLAPGFVVARSTRIRLDQHEPFGFRDGISNPAISWSDDTLQPLAPDAIPSGEIILGHRDSSGAVNDTPLIGRHGVYVVVRQLAQDVEAFWRFWRSCASNEAEAIWLAAKAVGRWPNGMPLQDASSVVQPKYDEDVVSRPLSFRNDLFGDVCPLGSHIRRSHPRDGLTENSDESITISRMHRILRRGRVFGPPVPPEWLPGGVLSSHGEQLLPAESNERGILFVGLCADIARQFEFVQQTWLNNPSHVCPTGEVDPIAAGVTNSPHSDSFSIPRLPVRRRVTGLKQFVSVRGAGYFLMPSRTSFEHLLSGASSIEATAPVT